MGSEYSWVIFRSMADEINQSQAKASIFNFGHFGSQAQEVLPFTFDGTLLCLAVS
jgi:hypothetical protein